MKQHGWLKVVHEPRGFKMLEDGGPSNHGPCPSIWGRRSDHVSSIVPETCSKLAQAKTTRNTPCRNGHLRADYRCLMFLMS